VNYYLFLMQLFFVLVAIVLLWQTILYYRRMNLWKRVLKMELPREWVATLGKIAHYEMLPVDLKEKLRPKMLYFAETKEFIGIKTEVTEEMRAVISFYACLMVVNIEDENYDNLGDILIYPHEVVSHEKRESGGIVSEEEALLDGESDADTVLIAWSEAKHEAFHPGKNNVIIHEFAHILDFEDFDADGTPVMEPDHRNRWNRVLSRHFEELRKRSLHNREWGEYSLFGAYAAVNEAEFFAVASERFFQRPNSLKKHFLDIYKEFEEFYGLDTAKLFWKLG